MLDSFLIHRTPFIVNTSWQILDSSSIANSRLFKARHLSIHQALWFSIYRVSVKILSFSPISLDRNSLLSLPNSSNSTSSHSPLDLRPKSSSLHLVWSYFSLVSCISFFLPKFWVFEKLLEFFKIDEVFDNFWVGLYLNDF